MIPIAQVLLVTFGRRSFIMVVIMMIVTISLWVNYLHILEKWKCYHKLLHSILLDLVIYHHISLQIHDLMRAIRTNIYS